VIINPDRSRNVLNAYDVCAMPATFIGAKTHPMTEINLPAPLITFGPCPKCQTPIRLAFVEPDKPEYETRTYRCDACGHSETKTVKYR
jgi:hypothetical protein